MKLTLNTVYGKKVNLMAPTIETRQQLAELRGKVFRLDIDNQYSKEYTVEQVIAEPSPNTTIAWVILSFFISLFILKDEDHFIFFSFAISFLVYLLKSLFVGLDNKKVEKFNNS